MNSETDGKLCPLMKKRCCISECAFSDEDCFCSIAEAIEDIHLIAGFIEEKGNDLTLPHYIIGGDDD